MVTCAIGSTPMPHRAFLCARPRPAPRLLVARKLCLRDRAIAKPSTQKSRPGGDVLGPRGRPEVRQVAPCIFRLQPYRSRLSRADPSGLAKRFESARDVDAVAKMSLAPKGHVAILTPFTASCLILAAPTFALRTPRWSVGAARRLRQCCQRQISTRARCSSRCGRWHSAMVGSLFRGARRLMRAIVRSRPCPSAAVADEVGGRAPPSTSGQPRRFCLPLPYTHDTIRCAREDSRALWDACMISPAPQSRGFPRWRRDPRIISRGARSRPAPRLLGKAFGFHRADLAAHFSRRRRCGPWRS